MIGKFNYEHLSWYPHMKPADVQIWEIFMSQHPGEFDTCDYDFLVGEGVVMGDVSQDVYAKSFQILTQKKVDVIGYKGENIDIIEIKPFAGASAMGQVLSYRNLFIKQFPGLLPGNIRARVLTDRLQSDYAEIYASHGVDFVEVGGRIEIPL